MKKILLLGRTGLLGSAFFKILDGDKNLTLLAPSHQELDLLEFERVAAYIKGLNPDLIIDCVAYTNVEKAEEDRKTCYTVNVEILKALLKTQVNIIHFSTDYVFDVSAHEAITEDAPQDPLNYYGETKLEAEKLMQKYGKKWFNIRTSWLFGHNKPSFITKIIDKAKSHKRLEVVNDQIGRPTYAKDLAQHVIQHFITSDQENGHYHLQNSGEPVSWADLATFVVAQKGLETSIEGVPSEHYPTKARRPKNSILKNTKLPGMRSWKEAVTEYLEDPTASL